MGGLSSTVQQGQLSQGNNSELPSLDQIPAEYKSLYDQFSSGKGGNQVQGMQGKSTNSATSGQPMMGAPNQYPNTVGQWDNTQIKPTGQGGKGKGA